MNSKLHLFENMEFGSIRAMEIDGQPWFVSRDIAISLGYGKPENALNRHVEAQDTLKRGILDSNGHRQRTTLINESGMYRLIFSSKLPKAREFTHWVTGVVLPTIREFGAYVEKKQLKKLLADSEASKRLAKRLLEKTIKRNDKLMGSCEQILETNKTLAPKAAYYDDILQSPDLLPVSTIAQSYGMTSISFNELLHDLRIQYMIDGTWLLYQKYCGQGYTKSRTSHIDEDTVWVETLWTQKGRQFLFDTLCEHGVYPLKQEILAQR